MGGAGNESLGLGVARHYRLWTEVVVGPQTEIELRMLP